IDNTITLFGYKIREKNITVNKPYCKDLVDIPAYNGELNQVWTNIIDNAIYAVDQNGELTIETSCDSKNVKVKIIDNGAGISKEIMPKIFDPFFTTKNVGQGTGIGLDLVNRIVKHHKGELKVKNEAVALFISDQRMPEMEGIVFLEKAKEIFPDAKLVLLTAYSDIEAAIRAINNVKLDYYLSKPWNPPEEKLYPVASDLLEDWQALYKPDHEAIKIIGFQWSPRSHWLKEFLSGNLVPY